MEAKSRKTVKLAPRERDIVAGLLNGQAVKEIAGPLELSPGGVNGRIVLLTQKLGLSSRLEISKWAMQHPYCLEPGVYCEIGLHAIGCRCESPWCTWAHLRIAQAGEHVAGCRCKACLDECLNCANPSHAGPCKRKAELQNILPIAA